MIFQYQTIYLVIGDDILIYFYLPKKKVNQNIDCHQMFLKLLLFATVLLRMNIKLAVTLILSHLTPHCSAPSCMESDPDLA